MTAVGLEHRGKNMNVLHALVVGAAVFGFLFVLLWGSGRYRTFDARAHGGADADSDRCLDVSAVVQPAFRGWVWRDRRRFACNLC